jgi:hypothetical protein
MRKRRIVCKSRAAEAGAAEVRAAHHATGMHPAAHAATMHAASASHAATMAASAHSTTATAVGGECR